MEKFVIDVTEIIPLSPNTPNDAPNGASPNIPNQDLLPQLYSGLTWETAQKKILTFTSGKRRIEHEGVYLESSKLTDFPYDFINYYINQLQDSGFKQTLNKIGPDGIITSFEKMGIFFTFGVKNVYSGSKDNKQITGYKAYLEHN